MDPKNSKYPQMQIRNLTRELLTREELNDLVLKYQKGSIAARNRIVECNMRLVMTSVRRFQYRCGNSFDIEDLLQEGVFGLMRAVDGFDPKLGFAFSTYAVNWINQAIRRFIDNNAGIVRVPVHVSELQRRYYNLIQNEDCSDEEFQIRIMAAKMDVSVKTLKNAVMSFFSTTSIDNDLFEFQLKDSTDPVADNMSVLDFESLVKFLNDREQDVLRRRINKETLQEIAKHLKISRERVRQIQNVGLKKIFAVLKITDLRGSGRKLNAKRIKF